MRKQLVLTVIAVFFGSIASRAATIYAVNASGEIRSFTGAAAGDYPIENNNTFSDGLWAATIAGYGAYQGFTQTPDGTVLGISQTGGVDSWTSLSQWLAGAPATSLSSGVYGTGGIHGCSYDGNSGGFYVLYEGNGMDGDIGEYATLNDFINNQNATVTVSTYGANICNFFYPDSDSSAGAHYYQIPGSGYLEGFTTLASYAAGPANMVYQSSTTGFAGVGAAFAAYTDAQALMPPATLQAAVTNGTQIRIDWSAAPGAQSYNLYRSTASGSYGTPYQTGLTDLFFIDPVIAEYTTYYYTVTSVSNTQESAMSAEASAIIAGTYAPPNNYNILFIFIDDIGWGDLSCYGNTATTKSGGVITPHLDALAAEGIRFTQGYVGAPICSPSRVCVMTGIESQRYAIYSYLDNKSSNSSRNMNNWLDPYTVAAPRLFRDAGYMTGQFGKWHMGGGRDVNHAPFPQAYGFQESVVAFEGMGNRVLYNGDGLSAANADVEGSITWAEWYEGADLHTDAAIDFITRAVHSNKNFYVHVPYNDTHSPYNTDPGKEFDFDHISTHVNSRLFLSELHELDGQIGRLIQTLDDLGATSNTLVVVIGDNGAPNDIINANLNRNGGLRGGKRDLWEGGIREPYMVRCPGLVPAGQVNDTTAVSTLDLLPTYCSLAGIKLPDAPFAGENMLDVFMGSTRERGRPLFWEFASISGVATSAPKLATHQGNYKLLMNPDGSSKQLYDVVNDKEESVNLIGNPELQATIAQMETSLLDWYDETILGKMGDPVTVTNDVQPGIVFADSFDISGNDSLTTGFGESSGANEEFAARTSGFVASYLYGYRKGSGGRPESDFSIGGDRLLVTPRNDNTRFELSPDGSAAYNFGSYLAGNQYTLSVSLNVDGVGSSYAQRLSLSLSDTADAAIQVVDLGIQVGTDGLGSLGVFKRIDGASNSGGTAINSMIAQGYPIGTPVVLEIVVSDVNSNLTDYASSYEIRANGSLIDSGSFRFNASTANRYLIFDVAAHEYDVQYDDLQLELTAVNSNVSTYYRPVVTLSDPADHRIWWNAQPDLIYEPQSSTSLTNWTSYGLITNLHGSIRWFTPDAEVGSDQAFFRLK